MGVGPTHHEGFRYDIVILRTRRTEYVAVQQPVDSGKNNSSTAQTADGRTKQQVVSEALDALENLNNSNPALASLAHAKLVQDSEQLFGGNAGDQFANVALHDIQGNDANGIYNTILNLANGAGDTSASTDAQQLSQALGASNQPSDFFSSGAQWYANNAAKSSDPAVKADQDSQALSALGAQYNSIQADQSMTPAQKQAAYQQMATLAGKIGQDASTAAASATGDTQTKLQSIAKDATSKATQYTQGATSNGATDVTASGTSQTGSGVTGYDTSNLAQVAHFYARALGAQRFDPSNQAYANNVSQATAALQKLGYSPSDPVVQMYANQEYHREQSSSDTSTWATNPLAAPVTPTTASPAAS